MSRRLKSILRKAIHPDREDPQSPQIPQRTSSRRKPITPARNTAPISSSSVTSPRNNRPESSVHRKPVHQSNNLPSESINASQHHNSTSNSVAVDESGQSLNAAILLLESPGGLFANEPVATPVPDDERVSELIDSIGDIKPADPNHNARYLASGLRSNGKVSYNVYTPFTHYHLFFRTIFAVKLCFY
jgi:hypothetical protein